MASTKGMEKISSKLYIKQFNRRLLISDGTELFMAGKYIPAYVKPVEYWLRMNMVGDGVGVVPDAGVFLSYRLGLVETNTSQGQVETDDITGDEMIGRYMQPGINRFEDISDASETEPGIPMDQQARSSWWKARELEWYRTRIGLPDKAVFNDASLILFTDKFRSHGMIKNSPVPIDQPKFMAVGATMEKVDAQADWGDILFGGADDVGGLMELIYDNLGVGMSGVEVSERATQGSTLQQWLEDGFVTVSAVDQNCWMETHLTVRCEVYMPSASKTLSPF